MRLLRMVLALCIVRTSHQYLYACSSSAPCGCSTNPAIVTRIVGGEDASTRTWGWAVLVIVSSNVSGAAQCGGSILSSTWIMTAAHCIPANAQVNITIYAGWVNAFTFRQSRVASSIIVHPYYNGTTKENDMALVRLTTPINVSDPTVNIVCMPSVSPTVLAAGEWPAAGIDVSIIISHLLEACHCHGSIGRSSWLG